MESSLFPCCRCSSRNTFTGGQNRLEYRCEKEVQNLLFPPVISTFWPPKQRQQGKSELSTSARLSLREAPAYSYPTGSRGPPPLLGRRFWSPELFAQGGGGPLVPGGIGVGCRASIPQGGPKWKVHSSPCCHENTFTGGQNRLEYRCEKEVQNLLFPPVISTFWPPKQRQQGKSELSTSARLSLREAPAYSYPTGSRGPPPLLGRRFWSPELFAQGGGPLVPWWDRVGCQPPFLQRRARWKFTLPLFTTILETPLPEAKTVWVPV